jgi:hypothetical protein
MRTAKKPNCWESASQPGRAAREAPSFPGNSQPLTAPPAAAQASTHRYHHLHCDTPLDPHSPYEGFWWCHMGWILDHKTTLTRVGDRSNVRDIMKDPWYQVSRARGFPGWLAGLAG